jgi:putative peptidoglycan lipid II flippase
MGQAAFLLVAGAVLSRIFGFIRETAIAYQFGATAQTDAFLVASIIPIALSGLVAGAVAVVFIPIFTEYRMQKNEREAWAIASAVINLTTLGLSVACVLFMLAAPVLVPLLAPGLAPDTKLLAVRLSMLLAPALIFTGLAGLASAILNAYRHFTYPAFAGLLYNFGMIGGALLLGGLMGIAGLAVGVVAGAAAHLLVLTIPLASQKSCYRLTLNGLSHPGVKKIGLLVLPFIIASAGSQVNLLVDRILASGLAEGSISALNFAVRVMQLPLGIFAGAAATAAYPFLAEQAVDRGADDLRRIFSEGLRLLWFIVFPLSFGLIVLSEPIVRLLFERGEFDALATRMTAVALVYYSLGIFAHAASILLMRVYFALQDTTTPVKLGLWAVALNVVLNLVLVRHLAHGGLALATSIAAMVNCFLLAYYLRSRLGHLDGWRILRSAAKVAVSSAIMGITVVAVHSYTLSYFDLTIFTQRFMQVGGLIALGGAVYLASTSLLKAEELTKTIRPVWAKVQSVGTVVLGKRVK